MRFAYADPPYPGQSFRLYGDHQDYAGEVDHAELVARLMADYPDGWALSTAANVLPEILRLCPYERGTDSKNPGRVEPESSVRVLSWIKPQAPPYPVRVQYTWEPVILWGGRKYDGGPRTVRDHLIASPEGHTFQRVPEGHVRGKKPKAFCRWIFECLGACAGDELDDLFAGTGTVADEWRAFTAQGNLFEEALT